MIHTNTIYSSIQQEDKVDRMKQRIILPSNQLFHHPFNNHINIMFYLHQIVMTAYKIKNHLSKEII